MCNKQLRIEPVFLLSCGSFNPITVMHMRMMELARDKIENMHLSTKESHHVLSKENNQFTQKEYSDDHPINYDHQTVVVGGIFSPVSNLYEKKGLLPASIRVELTRLACISASDWLAVSNWECSQSSWLRTRVVLDHIYSVLNNTYSNLSNNDETEIDSVPRKKTCFAPSNFYPTDRLINEDHEQTKLSSLEGMATDLWLKSCFHLDSLIDVSNIKCSENQVHNANDDHFNSNLFPSLSSVDRSCYCRKNNTANVLLSKPCVKLVCGADLLESFKTPNLWSAEDIETIVRDYGIICISRPPYEPLKIINESNILAKYKDNISLVIDNCQNSLSSTFVRHALSSGKSVRYLVPDRTLEYIYTHKLYDAKKRCVNLLESKTITEVQH
ncbi:unnamed protein product [Schistosoma mattheei]|uniref:Nicotinate-nucleotide adenylyltransferase n=2 Tax=Schistosoma mattheei TaxID=31246 RepID=A0AA85BU45_9TREM|nr:unnamed protein product [Schistosoma mattheei]